MVGCCRFRPGSSGSGCCHFRPVFTSKGLGELAAWLTEAAVHTVAMEATGVYWKPVYYSLEGLFDELWLVNAQHVKNVPGRKTDQLTELREGFALLST